MGCVTSASNEPTIGMSRALAVRRVLGEAVTSARGGQAQTIVNAAKAGRGFRLVGDGGTGKTCLLRHARDEIAVGGDTVVIFLNFAEVCGEADLVWLCLRQLLASDATSTVTGQPVPSGAYQSTASGLREGLDAGLLAMAVGDRPFSRTDGLGVMHSLLECLARCAAAKYPILILVDHIESSLFPSSAAAGMSRLLTSLFAQTRRRDAVSVGVAHRPGMEHVVDHETVATVCESRETVILRPPMLPMWERIVSASIDPPLEVDLADLVFLTQGDVASTIGVLTHLAASGDEVSLADSYDTDDGAHPWTSAGAFASLAAGTSASRDAFTYLASLQISSLKASIELARELDVTGPNILRAVACNKASRQVHALTALGADERALRSLQFAGLIREDRDQWLVCNPLTARALRDLELLG